MAMAGKPSKRNTGRSQSGPENKSKKQAGKGRGRIAQKRAVADAGAGERVGNERILKITAPEQDGAISLAFDTVRRGKQALVFAGTKRGAEKAAEDISKKLKLKSKGLAELSEQVLAAMPSPTKQCIRLAKCIRGGAAFHHAGLVARQRKLIEDAFRSGTVPIIVCTPTLAAGVDLPAFRTILKDLRRYTRKGLTYISVLEYLQMSGRAGRPRYDTHGESVCIASSELEKNRIHDNFIIGEPEAIYSKLAVEPVLRTYLLSLISIGMLRTREEIIDFFEKTFWAHQYKDVVGLGLTIEKALMQLEKWEFIKCSRKERDFVSASDLDSEFYNATIIGKRVAELYLDPMTAFHIIKCLRRATSQYHLSFSFLQMLSNTLEMRPLLRVRASEWDELQDFLERHEELLLEDEPSVYEPEYEDFASSVKTALLLQDWIEEKHEDYLLDTYSIRPGELKQKLEIADWLLYSASELLKIMQFRPLITEIGMLRLRIKHGAKEELLPLLRLKEIGRVRARKLFRSTIKSVRDVRNADISTLSQILGKKVALNIKKQVGQDFDESTIRVRENKRKGQISLMDF